MRASARWRIAAGGRFTARAIASSTRLSSAPCRSSPVSSPARNCCSGSVARANSAASSCWRRAAEPAPCNAATAASTPSTSASVSVAVAAGELASASRTWANPTPILSWRSCPASQSAASGRSAAAAATSMAAIASVFLLRARVAATAFEHATRSASCMGER